MAANELAGEEEIELGGKCYVLCFNNRAIKLIEKALGGVSIDVAMQDVNRLQSLELLEAGIHAGMQYNPAYAKMTRQRIGALIEPSKRLSLAIALLRGYLAWLGKDPDTLITKDGEIVVSEDAGAEAGGAGPLEMSKQVPQ